MISFNQLTFPEIQKGTLYLIATPIGNLGDISLRALHTLDHLDVIFCEDTRISSRLLNAYNITTPLHIYHDHSGPRERDTILKRLQSGQSVGLISDAGTPLISDPGYKLVEECSHYGIPVTLIPGACALIQGLVMSGLPTDQFYFVGFLPLKEKDRHEKIALLASLPATLIFYETGPKLLKSLKDLMLLFKNRQLVVARELTKKFESLHRGTVEELCNYYTQEGPPKGELVLVLQGQIEKASKSPLDEALCKKLLEKLSVKDAVDVLFEGSHHSKKSIYESLLKLKNEER